MTEPEVDQELERLFSTARQATLPHPSARARIRAKLASSRLTADVSPPRRLAGRSAWIALGAVVLGVGAASWLAARGQGRDDALAASVPGSRSAALPPPQASPLPQLEVAVSPESAQASAPSASAELAPASIPGAARRASSRAAPASSANEPDELELIRSMQQALRGGRPDQALALAAEHARRYPRGALVEEREGVRAIARCQLSAPSSRRAVLDSFSRRFGSSPYVARVKAACR